MAQSRVWNFTIPPPEHGPSPAASTRLALFTQPCCFQMERFWSPAASVAHHLQLLVPNLTVQSYTILPPEHGVAAAVSIRPALLIRRRSCRMARYWSQEDS